MLGGARTTSGWERAIGVALEADFVAQHRVELQREEYPTMEPRRPRRLFYEDTDPFMFRGGFGGMLARLGGSEVTNVHATAASAPASPSRPAASDLSRQFVENRAMPGRSPGENAVLPAYRD